MLKARVLPFLLGNNRGCKTNTHKYKQQIFNAIVAFAIKASQISFYDKKTLGKLTVTTNK